MIPDKPFHLVDSVLVCMKTRPHIILLLKSDDDSRQTFSSGGFGVGLHEDKASHNLLVSSLCWISFQERESAVSEAYSKGLTEGKKQSATSKEKSSVNVTDEVSRNFNQKAFNF